VDDTTMTKRLSGRSTRYIEQGYGNKAHIWHIAEKCLSIWASKLTIELAFSSALKMLEELLLDMKAEKSHQL